MRLEITRRADLAVRAMVVVSVLADRVCDGAAPCSLHGAWTKARSELVGVLGGTTLSDVGQVAQVARVA